MGKRKKDRGEHADTVKNLRAAAMRAGEFLKSTSTDRNRGHFSEAAKCLIKVNALSIEALNEMGVDRAKDVFNTLKEGRKVKGLTSEQKRAMIQSANNTVVARLSRDFGIRLAA
jgi:hypothetical protein